MPLQQKEFLGYVSDVSVFCNAGWERGGWVEVSFAMRGGREGSGWGGSVFCNTGWERGEQVGWKCLLQCGMGEGWVEVSCNVGW